MITDSTDRPRPSPRSARSCRSPTPPGLLFYERVFTLAPGTRSMFDDDIGPQAKRTMAAVKTAVDGLG